MKKYTHAWLAFRAIERLNRLPAAAPDKPYAVHLVNWFMRHKDGVIQGAWYPDEVIRDNAQSHVLKFTPAAAGPSTFRSLPPGLNLLALGQKSALYRQPYQIATGDNLPERCESLAHAVINSLQVQTTEGKGSPIAPTNNYVALFLFMLSHYVADAHMPLHCDSRKFSEGGDLHARLEAGWEKEVTQAYAIDAANERFLYNQDGYPWAKAPAGGDTLLKKVDEALAQRPFTPEWGPGNDNVRDYMTAICQHAYLTAYAFLPAGIDETNVDLSQWPASPGQGLPTEALGLAVLTDAVDSIARVWLRIWRRYLQWHARQTKTPAPEAPPA